MRRKNYNNEKTKANKENYTRQVRENILKKDKDEEMNMKTQPRNPDRNNKRKRVGVGKEKTRQSVEACRNR